jgi:hypothetical protein
MLRCRTFLQTFQSGSSLSLRLSRLSVTFVALTTLALVWFSRVEGSDLSLKFVGSVIRPIDDYCSVSTSSFRWTIFFFPLGHGEWSKISLGVKKSVLMVEHLQQVQIWSERDM